jgi:hypothetical protein
MPIEVTLFGIVILYNPEFEKAASPKEVTVFGIVILYKLVQFLKQLFPIEVTI